MMELLLKVSGLWDFLYTNGRGGNYEVVELLLKVSGLWVIIVF